MSPLRALRRRLRALFGRKVLERDMDSEIGFHLEMEIEDRVRGGMSPAEARRTALRDFGGIDRFKEEGRDVRGIGDLEMLAHDARFAMRTLRRNPGFAAVAILTLALGIGANTAVFSVVDGTLLRPLPYADPDRIVVLHELGDEGQEMAVTGGNFLGWRERTRTFESIALHWNPEFVPLQTILGANAAVRVRVTGVSIDFFRVMGVTPVLGRGFTPEETRPGGPAVAIVSEAFWHGPLARDPKVLARLLDWDREQYEIIGVMPSGFSYPAESDIWVSLERSGMTTERTAHNYAAVGRLRRGVELEEAERDLTALTAEMKAAHGSGMDAVAARLEGLQDALVGNLRQPLLLLLGASGLVLLIACTNLATIFLARGAARQREVAVRSVLGASRPRLLRQLLTESALLSLLGAIAGVGVSLAVLRGLLALGPSALAAADISLNASVLAFALGTAFVTAILFGVFPAFRSSAETSGESLRAGSRGAGGPARGRAWSLLIGIEVALAVVLLVGAVLLLRSFREIVSVDAGFDPNRVLTVELSLPSSNYATDAERASYYARLLDEMREVPGVAVAGVIQHLPLGGIEHNGSFDVEGGENTHEVGVYPGYRVASGGYFEAMGIPLLQGRLFDERDTALTPDVAVVNRTLAERLWNGDAIGRRVRNLANDSWIYPDRWVTIVGIVGDVRHGTLLAEPNPEIYVHYLQRPNRAQSAVVTLGTTVPPARIAGAVRDRIHAIDPQVPATLMTMRARVAESVADRRFTMLVLAAFAIVAVLLAAVGIYGVVSYAVARRTREIGIRMALGADAGNVRALVQRSVVATTLAGMAAGTFAALLLSRVMQNLLYGIAPADPAAFCGGLAALAVIAWLASWIPARRTTRVDPIVTMRAE